MKTIQQSSLGLLLAWLLCATTLHAQAPPVHYPQRADMPPGAIGQHQLLRGGPLPGYFQPVRVHAPSGAKISLSADGIFFPPERNEAQAGMLIGSVYRFKVTEIPRYEGFELYPTVEIINRLYPPQGEELRFPIQVEIAMEDMEAALNGRFVTRVIYLENPEIARPERDDPNHQSYFDILPTEDPLLTADRLGKPMAILRMGSRVPTEDELDFRFFFGNPAMQLYPHWEAPLDEELVPQDAPALEESPLPVAPGAAAMPISYPAPTTNRGPNAYQGQPSYGGVQAPFMPQAAPYLPPRR